MRYSRRRRPIILAALLLAVTLSVSWSASLTRAQGGPTSAAPYQGAVPPYQPHPDSAPPPSIPSLAAQGQVRTFEAVADAEIRQESPTTNFGLQGSLGAGYADGTTANPARIHRALLHFDLATALPPGTTIHQARLELTVQSYCDYTISSRLTAYRVSQAWSERRVTWATQPTFAESYGVADIPVQTLRLPFSFDLTALAQAWVAGQQPEHGLLLRGPEAPPYNCAIRGFFSKGADPTYHPRLVVDYTLPAPALVSPDGDQRFVRATCADTPAPVTMRLLSNQSALAGWSATVSEGASWLKVAAGTGRVSRLFPDRLTLTVAADAPCDRDLQAQVTLSAEGLAAASFSVTLANPSPLPPPPPPKSRTFLPVLVTTGGGAPMGAFLARGPMAPADSSPLRIAIIIGVADYKHSSAEKPFTLFRTGGFGDRIYAPRADLWETRMALFEDGGFDQAYVLADDQATEENIAHFMGPYLEAQLGPSTGEPAARPAQVVIYFSGHGAQTSDLEPPDELDRRDEIIAPYDANLTDAGFTNVVLDDELGQWLGAHAGVEVAVILDSCFSGGMELGSPEHALLAASREDQESWETSLLEHGVFTYYLLEALRSPANDVNHDGWISIGELSDAVQGPVEAYVQQHGLDAQNPVAHIDPGHDIPVVKLAPAAAGQ